ncbi:unnamed protein product [Amoebophrya sp. A25]|nr:unnamed protein product [Amoebophrya sp. A25]|eukprot:GSA25T00000897001.1
MATSTRGPCRFVSALVMGTRYHRIGRRVAYLLCASTLTLLSLTSDVLGNKNSQQGVGDGQGYFRRTREVELDPCPVFGSECFKNPLYKEFFWLWHQHTQVWNPDSTSMKNNTVMERLVDKAHMVLARWIHHFPAHAAWISLSSLEVVENRFYSEEGGQKRVKEKLCFGAFLLAAFLGVTEGQLQPIIPQAVAMSFDVLKICRADSYYAAQLLGEVAEDDRPRTTGASIEALKAEPVVGPTSSRATSNSGAGALLKKVPRLVNPGEIPIRPSDGKEVAAFPCCIPEDIKILSDYSKHPAWDDLWRTPHRVWTSAAAKSRTRLLEPQIGGGSADHGDEEAVAEHLAMSQLYRFNADFFHFFRVTPQQLLYRSFLVVSSRVFRAYMNVSGLKQGLVQMLSQGKFQVTNMDDYSRGQETLAINSDGVSITEETKNRFFSGDGKISRVEAEADDDYARVQGASMKGDGKGGTSGGDEDLDVQQMKNSEDSSRRSIQDSRSAAEDTSRDQKQKEPAEDDNLAAPPRAVLTLQPQIGAEKLKGHLELEKREWWSDDLWEDAKKILYPVSLMRGLFQLGYRYKAIRGWLVWELGPSDPQPPLSIVRQLDLEDHGSGDPGGEQEDIDDRSTRERGRVSTPDTTSATEKRLKPDEDPDYTCDITRRVRLSRKSHAKLRDAGYRTEVVRLHRENGMADDPARNFYALPLEGTLDRHTSTMYFDFDPSMYLGDWVKVVRRSVLFRMNKLVFHVQDAAKFQTGGDLLLHPWCNEDSSSTRSDRTSAEALEGAPVLPSKRQSRGMEKSEAQALDEREETENADDEEEEEDGPLILEESAADLREKHKFYILDIGMGLGADTQWYLHQGFHVVTVESNPNSIFRARHQFSDELQTGQLTLLNYGIVGENKATDFYRNSTYVQLSPRAETSKLVNNDEFAWRSMFVSDGTTQHQQAVRIRSQWIPSLSCGALVKTFGMPYFMKIDVEENSIDCLRSLLTDGIWFERRHNYVASHFHAAPSGKVEVRDADVRYKSVEEPAMFDKNTANIKDNEESGSGPAYRVRTPDPEGYRATVESYAERNKRFAYDRIENADLYEKSQGGYYTRKPNPVSPYGPPSFVRVEPPRYVSIEIDSMQAFSRAIFPTAEALGYNRFKIARQYVYAPKICLARDEPCGAGLFGELAVDLTFGTRWRTRDEVWHDINWMREIHRRADWFDLHMTKK